MDGGGFSLERCPSPPYVLNTTVVMGPDTTRSLGVLVPASDP